MVVQFPEKANPPILNGCRALFLNAGGNVHSMIRKDRVLTGEVWDQLAILPGLVPEGPVGLLGLGAATVAHIIRRYWPERVMHGWELDAKVLDIAREYLEMSRLEGYGCLVAHVGDALSDEATVEGGFAGVIVDIFADNALVPALTQEATWRSLRSRLRPGGRIITNLGLVPSTDLDAPAYQTLRAMHRVFDGAVMVHELESDYTLNMLALTGKPLGEADWQASLPADLVPRPGSWLFQFSSAYNPNIAVVQFPEGFNPPLLSGSRALFLDRSGNVHSLYNKDRVITGQYWDQLAVLPAFVSEGPIAVLGLGAGTVAHILHKYWPERVMHGWELDQVVVQVCRDFMGLRELEERGAVVVHCANAFDEDATVEGGFAGILVDLFANAELLPELALESTWMQLQSRLRPGGRIIINLGPPPKDIDSLPYKTLAAMHAVFDGKVMCQVVATDDCNNAVAMTGDVPEPGWLDLVPKFLQEDADSWRTWMPALQF
ncbi:hypothetical protein WJX72_004639 [[Myrmecia] bisecta]|uniref:PABS domain-containing protein n=1 Tax=[Myrmecia] bisecta TaxID=41462 RepID=A0AAW1Q629_9CHLO